VKDVEPEVAPSEQRTAACSGDACPPGPQDARTPGRAMDLVGLTGTDEATRRKLLVDQAARFSAAFGRWTDTACPGQLSYQQLRLLGTLHEHGPAIMREIGRELGVSPRNMTAMVDTLEQARLVARRPHPSDRRATLIELTPDGAGTVEKHFGPRLDAIAEIFASFSVQEQQAFYTALCRVLEAMRPLRDKSC
jgi:DNA-binding MarR family transcriptional regulator